MKIKPIKKVNKMNANKLPMTQQNLINDAFNKLYGKGEGGNLSLEGKIAKMKAEQPLYKIKQAMQARGDKYYINKHGETVQATPDYIAKKK